MMSKFERILRAIASVLLTIIGVALTIFFVFTMIALLSEIDTIPTTIIIVLALVFVGFMIW